MRGAAVSVALAVMALAACGKRAAEVELESLSEAVGRFHRASNADKPSAAEALHGLVLRDPGVVAVHVDCMRAADATAQALELKREVELGLAALEHGTLAKDSAQAQALPGKVDQAEALLAKGHDLMPRCDDGIARLERAR